MQFQHNSFDCWSVDFFSFALENGDHEVEKQVCKSWFSCNTEANFVATALEKMFPLV